MKKRDEIVEGSFLGLQLLAFAPALAVLILTFLGYPSPWLISLAFVLCPGIILYSMLTTGWATDNWSKAKYQRDGDTSGFYWLQFCFFGLVGVIGLIALVMVATGYAA